MAKNQKQNDDVPSEIFAAAPIEIVKPVEVAANAGKTCSIIVKPVGDTEGRLSVSVMNDGVLDVIEPSTDYGSAYTMVLRLAKKMCLVARGEGELKP